MSGDDLPVTNPVEFVRGLWADTSYADLSEQDMDSASTLLSLFFGEVPVLGGVAAGVFTVIIRACFPEESSDAMNLEMVIRIRELNRMVTALGAAAYETLAEEDR